MPSFVAESLCGPPHGLIGASSGTPTRLSAGPLSAAQAPSGKLAKVLQLYEPGAVVQGRDGRRHDGQGAIAALFEPILARGLRMETSARFLVEQGDLTLIRYDYRLFDGAGTPVHSASSSEVLRRSADGCWRLVIDLPSGADA